jgi:hypothetical protein
MKKTIRSLIEYSRRKRLAEVEMLRRKEILDISHIIELTDLSNTREKSKTYSMISM